MDFGSSRLGFLSVFRITSRPEIGSLSAVMILENGALCIGMHYAPQDCDGNGLNVIDRTRWCYHAIQGKGASIKVRALALTLYQQTADVVPPVPTLPIFPTACSDEDNRLL